MRSLVRPFPLADAGQARSIPRVLRLTGASHRLPVHERSVSCLEPPETAGNETESPRIMRSFETVSWMIQLPLSSIHQPRI